MGDLIINPFDNAGYDLATMTKAVNLIPNQYGRIREMGLFKAEPVRTRTIIVEELNGHLTLLKTQPNGAPAPKAKHGKGKIKSFIIPHIPYEDKIFPADIQGVREGGTGDPKTLATEMIRRLTTMRGSHAITEEHLLTGGMKGIVLDADGSVLYNWFDEFGITQEVVAFALTTDTTKVKEKCRAVIRHIEDNLLGEVMSGVRCVCGETFFDALIDHPNVEKFFVNYAEGLERIGSGGKDPRKGFPFGGITFEEYRGKATDPTTGSARAFVGVDDAHFFPEGTQDTFKIHYAPADHLGQMNAYGLPIFAQQTMDPKGKHVDIDTESNPLPICRRPGVLVKGTKV